MRISDWSSDVCSSDLQLALDLAAGLADGAARGAGGEQYLARKIAPVDLGRTGGRNDVDHLGQSHHLRVAIGIRLAGGHVDTLQIGQAGAVVAGQADKRSEEHTSELQSLMRISYAVFCLKKKKITP